MLVWSRCFLSEVCHPRAFACRQKEERLRQRKRRGGCLSKAARQVPASMQPTQAWDSQVPTQVEHAQMDLNNCMGMEALRCSVSVVLFMSLGFGLCHLFAASLPPTASSVFSRFINGGVQWKQGVVVHIILQAVLLCNTTPIHCTPLPLHPPVMNAHRQLRRFADSSWRSPSRSWRLRARIAFCESSPTPLESGEGGGSGREALTGRCSCCLFCLRVPLSRCPGRVWLEKVWF